jgi:1,4-alpha-glucan branching enzyme
MLCRSCPYPVLVAACLVVLLAQAQGGNGNGNGNARRARQEQGQYGGRMMGPHLIGSSGVAFRVWAPHASQVWLALPAVALSPLGMRSEPNGMPHRRRLPVPSASHLPLLSGTWYVQVPAAQPGQSYNYIINYQGRNLTRLDPLARDIIVWHMTASLPLAV